MTNKGVIEVDTYEEWEEEVGKRYKDVTITFRHSSDNKYTHALIFEGNRSIIAGVFSYELCKGKVFKWMTM
jgi:hypothetical protein